MSGDWWTFFNWQNVTSSDAALKKRVEAVLDMAVTTVGSLAESFAAMAPIEDDDTELNKDKSQYLSSISDMEGIEAKWNWWPRSVHVNYSEQTARMY